MVESSTQDPDVFTPQEINRIYRQLKTKSIEGFWEVGSLLNSRFGERAPQRALPQLGEKLCALGDDAPTSLAQLHQCRRLHVTWTERDVQAAARARLPWGRAIVLISIWGEGSKRNQLELIEQCKTLIASYPELERKTWEFKLNTLRKLARSGDEFISKRRLLGEKKAAVIHRLTAAAHMIEEMLEFLPAEAHAACTGLSAQARGMNVIVEMLWKEHAAEESKAQ